MRFRVVLSGIGTILLIFPIPMLLPLLIGFLYQEPILDLLKTFLLPALFTLSIGLIITSIFGRADKVNMDIRPIEGMVTVAILWLLITFFGSLPYMLSGAIPNIVDAYFETISGFSTTGASVLNQIDGLDHSILFWRSFTQWLGGMGVIVLMVAFFPMFLGGAKAGLLLLRGEVPGHSADKLVPRIKETSKYLFITYVVLTVFGTVLLTLLGMSVFDAVCHTFTALATGGFGTHTVSVLYFKDRPTYELMQLALMLLMLLGSTSFVLHYNLIFKRGWRGYLKSPELRIFLIILIIAWCFVALNLALSYRYGPWESLLNAGFAVTSLNSTTGYSTEDFNLWPSFSQFIFLILMIFGGMTGSTCGGLKTARLMIAVKKLKRSLTRIGHPKAVSPLKIGDLVLPEKTVKMIGMFIFGYLSTLILGAFILTLTGLDFTSSFSAAISTLGGVGPGLNVVGPLSNYSTLSPIAKLTCSSLMWLGRLELITGFILFIPSTYKT